MNIRPYTEPDRSKVAALWKTVFDYQEPRNQPSFVIDSKTAFGDGLFFVACDGETIVGTIMAGYDGHRGWIYALAVAPARRRRGVGSNLLKHAEDRLRERGCPKINMQVLDGNEGALRFYETCGFKIEERVSLGKTLGT